MSSRFTRRKCQRFGNNWTRRRRPEFGDMFSQILTSIYRYILTYLHKWIFRLEQRILELESGGKPEIGVTNPIITDNKIVNVRGFMKLRSFIMYVVLLRWQGVDSAVSGICVMRFSEKVYLLQSQFYPLCLIQLCPPSNFQSHSTRSRNTVAS